MVTALDPIFALVSMTTGAWTVLRGVLANMASAMMVRTITAWFVTYSLKFQSQIHS